MCGHEFIHVSLTESSCMHVRMVKCICQHVYKRIYMDLSVR